MPSKPKSIIVVDDEAQNVALLLEILKLDGHHVRPTTSSEQALTSALNNPPDLLITDLKMPDLTGIELSEKLLGNKETQQVPVIIMSGVKLDDNDEIPSNIVASLLKPVDINHVRDVVNRYLH